MHAPQGPLGGTPRPTAERADDAAATGTTGTTSASSATTAAGRSGRGRPDGRLPLPRLTLRHGSAARAESPRTESPRTESPRALSASTAERAAASAEDGEIDWRAVGLFGAGLALGALLGAGTALLMAPASGFETRMRLARAGRHARSRAADRWDSLEDRARQAARQGKRQLARRLTMARWRAQDAWERKRYGDV